MVVKLDDSIEDVLADWKSAYNALFEQCRIWASELGWLADEYVVRIDERRLGPYQLRELVLHARGHRLLITPVARDVVGAEGRVDIEMFPSMARMVLVRKSGEWSLRTDGGVPWPESWSKKTLSNLVDLLADAR